MNRYDRFPRRRLYRSRRGVIFGVCQGLADYFGFSLFWIRMIMVIILLFSGIWPILGLYLLAALIIKPEPVQPIEDEAEQEFYDSYVYSRHGAAQRLKQRFQKLDRRIRRMEDMVTSREFDWDRRMGD
jgi:phage shock protein C